MRRENGKNPVYLVFRKIHQTYTPSQAAEERRATFFIMSIVTVLRTPRGAERAQDNNGYNYHFNRKTEKVKYWRCTQNGCSVRLASRISSSQLVGENLPEHDHTTNLMKRKAKEVEVEVIKRFASVSGSKTKSMLCEISNKLLSSSQPNTLSAMRTCSALKSALLQEKNKINPLPTLPKTFSDIMSTDIPTKLSLSADGKEFLITNAWINVNELESMMVFMSDDGADILRRAPTWMVDGTFKVAPDPFYQVKYIYVLSVHYCMMYTTVCCTLLYAVHMN